MRNLGVVLLTLVFLGSSVVVAQPRMGVQAGPRAAKEPPLKVKLNLTEAQEKEMKNLRLDLEKKQTQVQSKIKLERLDLKGLAMADNPDKAAIEKKVRTISDLQNQLKLNWVDHWFAVKAILTPEQQKIWKEEAQRQLTDWGGPMRDRVGERMQQRQMMRQHVPEKEDRN